MSSKYGPGVIGLLKRGWNEIPSVMGGSVMGLLGIGIGIYSICKYHMDALPPRYKTSFIIYRSDDPRGKRPTRDNL